MGTGGLLTLLAGGTVCGVAMAAGLLMRAGWGVWGALRCLTSVVRNQTVEYADDRPMHFL